MGGIHTDLVVSNSNTKDGPQTIRNAPMDTGATHTVLPAATLHERKLSGLRYEDIPDWQVLNPTRVHPDYQCKHDADDDSAVCER